eukprot:Plantae.Rhodophyta-Hildenbrandia_rubra.ctg20798.p1 GENE.Plantae.Rhodophyta-Hildenbrandia_rubra.ctg20798~~Plantae.Rhodophyta-Hildenbrandia_rubra.ctg20798.p1  ORF type:complete len:425 (+),score=57.99 Plantae.Rhodophyta-Hildenbrandia_rubra.ctg20798:445-1719(+)
MLALFAWTPPSKLQLSWMGHGGGKSSGGPKALPQQLQNGHVCDGRIMRRRKQPGHALTKLSAQKASVQNFQVGRFRPSIVRNGHLQTILGHFRKAPEVVYERVEVESDDGVEMLRVDVAGNLGKDQEKVALLFHGLESDSKANFSRGIVAGLVAEGWTVACLNNRCCGTDAKVAVKTYHAGFIEDVRTAVRWAQSHWGDAVRLYLVGFSLGANMLLNFLGIEARNVLEWSVAGAVAISVPWDPTACQTVLDSPPINRTVYSSRFVKSIQDKVQQLLDEGVDLDLDVEKVMKAKTIGEIDDFYISPIFGFENRFDYYNKTDARKMLKTIAVPTICYNARDDPFFAHKDMKSLPTKEMIGDAPVRVVVHKTGGHCGWVEVGDVFNRRPPYVVRETVRFFNHLERLGTAENQSNKFVPSRDFVPSQE